jgi:hypothetical protein
MPDQQQPNEASRKSKAEGERWIPEDEHGEPDRPGESRTDEQGTGSANRPLDREIEDQETLVNRTRAETTPRRYDQPIEEDDDAVLPAGGPTVDTRV